MNIKAEYYKYLSPQDVILYLNLKKKWFDMIALGIKWTEYREIKPYWYARLTDFIPEKQVIDFKHFDKIIFKNGYSDAAPLLVAICNGISIEKGVLNWGSNPSKLYYAIHIGKILYNGSEYVI